MISTLRYFLVLPANALVADLEVAYAFPPVARFSLPLQSGPSKDEQKMLLEVNTSLYGRR